MNLATRVRGKNGKRGFTLIEILIVVVILGILAAIVIPQFTSASQEASMSSAKSQLQSVRSQIELFRVKNTGENPTITNGALTDSTDPTAVKAWFADLFTPPNGENPYLISTPVLPSGFQWVWDDSTGFLSLTYVGTTFPEGYADLTAYVTDVEAW